jgi:hypothetical protein
LKKWNLLIRAAAERERERRRRNEIDLVVHLVLSLHLLAEEDVDILPGREHDGLLGGRLGGRGEGLTPGGGYSTLALACGLVLLVVERPSAGEPRGHGGRICRRS